MKVNNFIKYSFVLTFLLLMVTSIQAQEKLTLEQSIQVALKNNPSVLSANQKVEAARGQLQQASGALFPVLKAEASTGKSYSDPQTVEITMPTTLGSTSQVYSFGITDPQDMRSYTLSLTQPLFTGGAAITGLSSARKNFEVSKEEFRSAILGTTYDTTAAYFAVLQAKKFVDLSVQSLDMRKTHLKRVKAMFSAGMSTKADILRSDVALANANVAFLKARNGLIIAKNSFNNLLGYDLDQEITLSGTEFEAGVKTIPSYKILLKTAYENRPDWKQFLLSEKMAEDAVKIARAQMLPSIFAIGTYGNSIYDNPIYSSDTKSWTAMLSGSWTLFDLKIPGRIKEAQAKLEAQRSNKDAVKNGIALEVRNTYFELKSAMETIGSTKKAQDLAEENHKVADMRYNAGLGTNLEVLDAQVALTQARIDHLKAQFDLQTAKAKINKSIGKAVY